MYKCLEAPTLFCVIADLVEPGTVVSTAQMPKRMFFWHIVLTGVFMGLFVWMMVEFTGYAATPISFVTVNITNLRGPDVVEEAPPLPTWFLPMWYSLWPMLRYMYVLALPDYYYTSFIQLVDTPKYMSWFLTAPAMTVQVAIFCGVKDAWGLYGVACNTAACIAMGYVNRMVRLTGQDTIRRLTMALSFLFLTLALIPSWKSFNSLSHTTTEIPEFVTAVLAVMTIMLYSFGFVEFVSQYCDEQAPYNKTVYAELFNDFVSKFLLGVLSSRGLAAMYGSAD
jgi:hypothetical protein